MNIEKNSIIAKRYAKSLLDLSTEDGYSKEEISKSLQNTRTILKNSDDLFNVMTNPIISAKNKEEIIDAVFTKDVNETVRNSLKLLINKNRFNLIYSIVEIFAELLDEANNTINVDVVCAVELEEEKKNLIQQKLKEKLNKTVNVIYKKDETIIAGLIYKIGDDVIDTSLLHKLDEIKKEIIK